MLHCILPESCARTVQKSICGCACVYTWITCCSFASSSRDAYSVLSCWSSKFASVREAKVVDCSSRRDLTCSRRSLFDSSKDERRATSHLRPSTRLERESTCNKQLGGGLGLGLDLGFWAGLCEVGEGNSK